MNTKKLLILSILKEVVEVSEASEPGEVSQVEGIRALCRFRFVTEGNEVDDFMELDKCFVFFEASDVSEVTRLVSTLRLLRLLS